ncbi:AlwI family type II restriction endonuclease [Campylobacter sp. VBCF_05 NA6]|uniref:AlwI family type II restriction endonuclease n=1 Tax=unclassified Campylobacter TaxID=2593542 RepID=UPI0022E9FDF9|nr:MULTISPECIES: AlwI family type II restriction endonuclease [unclassified Campylobacter]MDA3057641.1 AlwI family type II restriction endonuclease [Campylobacter sp. VBCF_04 NA7]MDA3058542.1 AlwI family type II restriction endonuclease [Campylobacter sp. VBCF_05 NA6]
MEDFGLIVRKDKKITQSGYELLSLLKNEAYKKENLFLQIDLISLFFLKACLNFKKDYDDMFVKYLQVFKKYNGILDKNKFKFLPLISNFENLDDFFHFLDNADLREFVNSQSRAEFLEKAKKGNFDANFFKTAKGNKTALNIIEVLKKMLEFRSNGNKNILKEIIHNKNFKSFKSPYLGYILDGKTKETDKISELEKFCNGSFDEFVNNFYDTIFIARISANLDDYADLNKRHLALTGIFDFSGSSVELSQIFKIILQSSKYDEILSAIKMGKISIELLNEYLDDDELKIEFLKLGISNFSDLKDFKRRENLKKMEKLIAQKFSKENIIEILKLFSDRNNDDKIASFVTKEATIPTIFEYIVAIAWHYIDDCKIERILDAGLSLDNDLLPKSHAVGGASDFLYDYNTHELMIEVTLTEATNQRRAEMESVSRHLGNLLLNLNENKAEKSYAIFIAPYLDKNVLNDFRSRIYCYFENDKKFIKGMNILPLSSDDLVQILISNKTYLQINADILEIFKSKNDFGSHWYQNEIKNFIENLQNV